MNVGLLLVVLIVLCVLGIPNFGPVGHYGWGPSGGIGLILLVVIILLVLGRI
jgi:uncharacterized protein DUF3309